MDFRTHLKKFSIELKSLIDDANDPTQDDIRYLVSLSNVIGNLYLKEFVDADSFIAMKEFAHSILSSELLMHSPWMHQAYTKPFGYPGDFETMIGLYEQDRFLGETKAGKIINQVFTSTAAAQAVRNRKDILVQSLTDLLIRSKNSRKRILSIASGPAWELSETLKNFKGEVNCDIVLIDQDLRALNNGHDRLREQIKLLDSYSIQTEALNINVVDCIAGTLTLNELGQFDAILAAGIFDYFGDTKWKKLVSILSERLNMMGSLFVGNMVPTSQSRWFMEMYLDWHLKYRTTDKMLQLAKQAVPDRDAIIVNEATGVNPFVVIR